MTRRARRTPAAILVGAMIGLALAACGGSNAPETAPAPQVSVFDTITFAPILEVDLSKFTRRGGLYYRDLTVGNGSIAAVDRTIRVKYMVSLPNGLTVEAQTTPADFK